MSELSPKRNGRITGSDGPVICNGNAADLLDLWLVKTGQKEPEDLSDHLPAALGKHVEPFIREWVQKTEGAEITENNRLVEHPTLPWACTTLDGYMARDDAVTEFKFCVPWRKRAEIIKWYTPQVCMQISCRGSARGYLYVLQGIAHIDRYEIDPGDDYYRQMWERLAAFQLCVSTLTPPVPLPAPLTPPEQYRSVDFRTAEEPLPNWMAAIEPALKLWAETKDHYDQNEIARADIKALLPGDVGELVWNELMLTRNRRGVITIKRQERS